MGRDDEEKQDAIRKDSHSARRTEPGIVTDQTQTPAVGIDLGTTFSVVAHLDSQGRPWTIASQEGDPTTPSVVLFDDGQVIVGSEATTRSQRLP